MNTNKIYIGNIMYDNKIYMENAVLLYNNGKFYNLSEIPYYFAKKYRKKDNKLMGLDTIKKDGWHIQSFSLRPYYDKRYHKSLKKVYEDIKTNN
ncbi:MAG: hypothetical protein IJD92_02090 [Bacilli bacterium]|nr:hypothetical protein [Bacilli bacterium]